MNIKYDELSVIGKVWTIAEMFCAGVKDNKKSYVLATIRRLNELNADENAKTSKAVFENTMLQIIENTERYKFDNILTVEDIDDESIVSRVWCCRLKFDKIKWQIKNDNLTQEAIETLNSIFYEIRRFWVSDLKFKVLESKERRDLFKIKEEIEDLKIKIENRVKRNQITII